MVAMASDTSIPTSPTPLRAREATAAAVANPTNPIPPIIRLRASPLTVRRRIRCPVAVGSTLTRWELTLAGVLCLGCQLEDRRDFRFVESSVSHTKKIAVRSVRGKVPYRGGFVGNPLFTCAAAK
jgi:hypothetical protein